MASNLERYKRELAELIERGKRLHIAIQAQALPEEFGKVIRKVKGKEEADAYLKELPSFRDDYQAWYSEARAVVRQLLPDRLADFVRHYEKPKGRKDITFDNYRIEDFLQGLHVNRVGGGSSEKIVGPDAAIPHFRQQVNILKSAERRFESSLFELRQLVQADLLDSEMDAATVLLKGGFLRAAGAVAGVVLEKHLAQVLENHSIKLAKKSPTIAELNNALKENGIIDIAQWRFVQHLGDIRNLCDHHKATEPSKDQVTDLLAGVTKVSRSVY
jgi:hypothetical protein